MITWIKRYRIRLKVRFWIMRNFKVGYFKARRGEKYFTNKFVPWVVDLIDGVAALARRLEEAFEQVNEKGVEDEREEITR